MDALRSTVETDSPPAKGERALAVAKLPLCQSVWHRINWTFLRLPSKRAVQKGGLRLFLVADCAVVEQDAAARRSRLLLLRRSDMGGLSITVYARVQQDGRPAADLMMMEVLILPAGVFDHGWQTFTVSVYDPTLIELGLISAGAA